MRIIAGKHKNRKIITKLKGVRSSEIRPTTDKTRQAVFNILNSADFALGEQGSIIEGAVVADICSGTGAFGLEAFSRGAQKVFFIDIMSEHLRLVQANLEKIGEIKNAVLLRADARQLPQIKEKCDLVYIDPPYDANIAGLIIKSLIKSEWLKQGSIIVAEVYLTQSISALPEGVELVDERKYGNTKLWFYQVKA
jgi:16S rRNA (guanine966-N2)-methyltransferase